MATEIDVKNLKRDWDQLDESTRTLIQEVMELFETDDPQEAIESLLSMGRKPEERKPRLN